jgi:ABC-2 type transport system ATP-binding protein
VSSALVVSGAVKRYGATVAVAGADLACPGGAVTALIGPNGAGKSTLMLATAGLVRLDAGTIAVRGHAAGTPAAQRAVSLMPEQPDLHPGVSVWEHVAFVALLFRLRGWRPRGEELLARFGLAERRDALPHELSQGLRRRLALVLALLRGADVLLLDEPFNGLDPRSARELRAHVRELAAAGACVVVATHLLGDVERMADEVVLVAGGQARAQGSPAELCRLAGLAPYADLEDAYLALTAS